MSVLVVGVSHKTAPVSVLERLALDADAVAKLVSDVVESEHVLEATRQEIVAPLGEVPHEQTEGRRLGHAAFDVGLQHGELVQIGEERGLVHVASGVSGRRPVLHGDSRSIFQCSPSRT